MKPQAAEIHDAYIFIATGSIGLVANIAQLILICLDKNQRNSVFGLAVLSLDIADILASFATLYRGVVFFLSAYALIDDKLFGKLMYSTGGVVVFSLTSSFTHLIFIALQRVVAVSFPFKAKQILTRCRCYVILILVWLISVALGASVYIDAQVFTELSYLGMVTGVTLIAAYSVICYKTVKRSVVGNVSEETLRRRQQSENEVLTYSVAITVVYVVCNLPKGLERFIDYPAPLEVTVEFLCTMNPFFDTLLYFAASYYRRRRERSNAAIVDTPRRGMQKTTLDVTTRM